MPFITQTCGSESNAKPDVSHSHFPSHYGCRAESPIIGVCEGGESRGRKMIPHYIYYSKSINTKMFEISEAHR